MTLIDSSVMPEIYYRVEQPRIFGKYQMQFNLVAYITHPVTSEPVAIGNDVMECEYLIAGDNVFKQCYAFVREKMPDVNLQDG